MTNAIKKNHNLPSQDEPVVAEQPKTAETPKADAAKFVERPAAVEPTADQPKADLSKPVSDRKAEKPKHKR